MDLPAVGDRIRSGSVARVLKIEEPNATKNVRCLVESVDGRLGWIVYYAEGGRSNVNFFPAEEADMLRTQLRTQLLDIDRSAFDNEDVP